jgi:predicted nucleic-acid-binding Zn-ribbon protein
MSNIKDQLATAFICAKCHQHGAVVQDLAMSGTGLSRLLEIQPYRYVFASCQSCGYTEVYNLDILGKSDHLGNLFDILFMN